MIGVKNVEAKYVFIVSLALLSFFCGCGGRDPKPIAVYQPGDLQLSCSDLDKRTTQLRTDAMKYFPNADKGFTNGLWATGGAFLIVPYFFVDLKDAEKIEFEAYRQRHNYLRSIAIDKGCRDSNSPEIPSLMELKTLSKQGKLKQSSQK